MSRVWEELRQAESQRAGMELSSSKTRNASTRLDRREKLRHSHNVPLLIYGSDVEKQPFHEEAITVDANENVV